MAENEHNNTAEQSEDKHIVKVVPEELIFAAIKNRVKLPDPVLAVSKILEVDGMLQYLRLCCERIADADLLNTESARIDFVNYPDIVLTADGLYDCRDILECYVSDETLMDVYAVLCKTERIYNEINGFLEYQRKTKTRFLIRTLWEYRKDKDKDKMFAKQCLREEIYSRTIFAKLRAKIISVSAFWYTKIKYRKLFTALRREAASGRKENGIESEEKNV